MSAVYYRKTYNKQTMAKKSSDRYALSGTGRENWITTAKKNNIDISEKLKEIGIKVSEGIIKSPTAVAARSENMRKLNEVQLKDPEYLKILSDRAKITSARPEIQEQRTANLHRWRLENPDEFYEKCSLKMINSFQSKPEKKLFEFVSSLINFSFKRNQFINSLLISTKSHNKQIDMADKEKRIYIEFDGILHFKPQRGIEKFFNIIKKDNETDQHIINHNWIMIRVSYDQFKYSTKTINKIKQDNSYFKQECLDKLLSILNNNLSGVYKIGEAYGKY